MFLLLLDWSQVNLLLIGPVRGDNSSYQGDS
jgi:hypothetical protein